MHYVIYNLDIDQW